jgi:hypothetical protein
MLLPAQQVKGGYRLGRHVTQEAIGMLGEVDQPVRLSLPGGPEESALILATSPEISWSKERN